MNKITADTILPLKESLENHPVYAAIETVEDLQCFMEHHVYSVWDFMSLLKYIQSVVAPTSYPWIPKGNANIRRLINEIVLAEETDETLTDGQHSSHFELYQTAMTEIGADIESSNAFIDAVGQHGVHEALIQPYVPQPSREFTTQTFAFIDANKPHQVAAALALGREHIIPDMFRAILNKTNVSASEAPTFHYYLERHIDIDDGVHAPLSLKLLNGLCGDDEIKVKEAVDATQLAIHARLKFWDGVLDAINAAKNNKKVA